MSQANQLPVNAVPLSRFHWDNKKKSLSVEHSDLSIYPNWFCVPLYNDAADVGIAIHSETTGVVHRFYLNDTIVNGENEVLEWKFKPIDETCPVRAVTIFND